jgi:GNAT superfamily N-acetyltransferase
MSRAALPENVLFAIMTLESRVYTESQSIKKNYPVAYRPELLCFAISPKMQRKVVASRLVERVCLDAADDGFDFVEAYPNKEFIDEAEDFMGPVALYEKSAFSEYYETEEKLVMRKQLK